MFIVRQIIQKLRTPRFIQGIPIPSYLKLILDFWIDELRPLYPGVDNNIKSCWINQNGTVAESTTITKWFTQVIQLYFPSKSITPACLRRIQATQILVNRLVSRTPTGDQFGPEDMGNLMLNSFDTIEKHYMRQDATSRQVGLQNAYKKSIGVDVQDITDDIVKELTGESPVRTEKHREYPSEEILVPKKLKRTYETRQTAQVSHPSEIDLEEEELELELSDEAYNMEDEECHLDNDKVNAFIKEYLSNN